MHTVLRDGIKSPRLKGLLLVLPGQERMGLDASNIMDPKHHIGGLPFDARLLVSQSQSIWHRESTFDRHGGRIEQRFVDAAIPLFGGDRVPNDQFVG
jgi:hypothetical protein